jgi:hypothetical protein
MIGLSGTFNLPFSIVIFAPPAGTVTFVYAILFLLATNDARDYNIRNSEKSSDDCHDKTYGFQIMQDGKTNGPPSGGAAAYYH